MCKCYLHLAPKYQHKVATLDYLEPQGKEDEGISGLAIALCTIMHVETLLALATSQACIYGQPHPAHLPSTGPLSSGWSLWCRILSDWLAAPKRRAHKINVGLQGTRFHSSPCRPGSHSLQGPCLSKHGGFKSQMHNALVMLGLGGRRPS